MRSRTSAAHSRFPRPAEVRLQNVHVQLAPNSLGNSTPSKTSIERLITDKTIQRLQSNMAALISRSLQRTCVQAVKPNPLCSGVSFTRRHFVSWRNSTAHTDVRLSNVLSFSNAHAMSKRTHPFASGSHGQHFLPELLTMHHLEAHSTP